MASKKSLPSVTSSDALQLLANRAHLTAAAPAPAAAAANAAATGGRQRGPAREVRANGFKEQEAVYEFTPEVTQKIGLNTGVGNRTAMRPPTISSLQAQRDAEAIDSSELDIRSALLSFLQREADQAEARSGTATMKGFTLGSGNTRGLGATKSLGTTKSLGVTIGPMALSKPRSRLLGGTMNFAGTRTLDAGMASRPRAATAKIEEGPSGESPEERYTRLHLEVSMLLQQAEEAAASRGTPGDAGTDPMVAELRQLSQSLSDWRKTQKPTDSALTGAGSMAEAVQESVDRVARGGDAADAGAGAADKVTWDIQYTPSTEAIAMGYRLAEIESTTAEIERKVGEFDPVGPHADIDVEAAMAALHRRLGLLESVKLDGLRAGAAKVSAGYDLLLARKAELPPPDPDIDKEISELYEICRRATPMAAALPSIVIRMRSLEAFHQQAASFMARLSALEHQQDELCKILGVTSSAVEELGKGMQDNMAIMAENIKALEAKLESA